MPIANTANNVWNYPAGYDNNFNFGNMLNLHLTGKFMYLKFMHDTYLMRKIKDFDRNWKGGPYPITFEGGETSNYQAGPGVISAKKFQRQSVVRGSVPNYKQIHTGLMFEHEDINRLNETDVNKRVAWYAQLIQRTTTRLKNRFIFENTQTMLTGQIFSNLTALTLVNSNTEIQDITVDEPERFVLGQRLRIKAIADASPNVTEVVEVYVREINISTGVIMLAATSDITATLVHPSKLLVGEEVSGTGLNVARFTIASPSTVTVHLPGNEEGKGFTSIKEQLLPAANGGSDTIFGLTKTKYPFLQAMIKDGSGIGNKVIGYLDMIFDLFEEAIVRGQLYNDAADSMPLGESGARSIMKRGAEFTDLVVSLKWYGIFMKWYQRKRGIYYQQLKGSEVPFYGGRSFVLYGSTQNALRVVGVAGMGDDFMILMGNDCMRLSTDKFIEPYVNPDNNKFFTIRTDGKSYSYLCDMRLYGDLVFKRPSGAAVLYGLKVPAKLDYTD